MKWWLGLIIATVLGLGCCCVGGIGSLFLIPGAVRDASWGRAGRDIQEALEKNVLVKQRVGVPVQLEAAPEYTVLIDDPDVIAWFISGDDGESLVIARVATDAIADKDGIDWALLRGDRQELLDLEGNPPRDWIHVSLGDELADEVAEAYRSRLEELLGPDPIAWIDWPATNKTEGDIWTVLAVSGPRHEGSIQLKIVWDEENKATIMSDATLDRDDDQRYYLGDPTRE